MSVGHWEPADCHVFSKHWDYGELELAKRSPCPIFDVCDDHFSGPHREYYVAMLGVCFGVVSSERLGERVRQEAGQAPAYIPEPYELPDGEPKEPGADPLALWFGHSSNLHTLNGLSGFKLLVCTNATGKGIIPYSPENLQRALAFCDLVIIPQTKDWKSANRMVESLRAGRFVVASDIPSYRGFSQYLGDIQEGVDWVKRNGPITQRIISGRNAISSFSPEAVGEGWLNFISAAVKRNSVGTQTSIPQEVQI